MDQNNQESVSNTGIVINKKAKVLVSSKVDKSFISKEQVKSGKENNKKLKEQKDAEKAKKKKNNFDVQNAIGYKGRKVLFVFSIIAFAFILLWLVFYTGGLVQDNHSYSSTGVMAGIVFGLVPITAIVLITLFILLLVNSIKQLKFASNKGFVNILPCIVTLIIDALTIICVGLIIGFYIGYVTSRRPIYSFSSFQLSTVIGISTFIVGYIMAYALTLNTNDVNRIKLISLFKHQLKLNLFIYGIIAFVFGITYSVVGLSSYEDLNVAAFYFGRSLIAIFIFGLFLMAGNIALTIVFRKDEPKFIVQIIVYSVILVASFVFSIVSGSKFTPANNPNDIKGGASVCMLINFIFVLGCGVYSFIHNKLNDFGEKDNYSAEIIKANLDGLAKSKPIAKHSEPKEPSKPVSDPSTDPKIGTGL